MIYVFCFMPDVNSPPFLKKIRMQRKCREGGQEGSHVRGHMYVFFRSVFVLDDALNTSEGSQLGDNRLLFSVLFN